MTESTETGMRNGGMVEAKGEVAGPVEVASALSSEGHMAVLVRIDDRLLVMSPDQAAALSRPCPIAPPMRWPSWEDRWGVGDVTSTSLMCTTRV